MSQCCTIVNDAKIFRSEASDIWLRMSEVSATMFILGLHQEKTVNEKTPLFLCELRTRLFEQVYAHDKVHPVDSNLSIRSIY